MPRFWTTPYSFSVGVTYRLLKDQNLCPSPALHLSSLDDAEEVVEKVDLLLRNSGIAAEFEVLEPEGQPSTVEMKWRPSEPWAESWLERAKEQVRAFVVDRGWSVTFDLLGARFEQEHRPQALPPFAESLEVHMALSEALPNA